MLQFLFAFLVLKTDTGRDVLNVISKWFVLLFGFALEGAQFVFGSLAKPPDQPGSLGFFFAFQVLPTIIFFAALMGTLYYLGIMQRVVQGMAWLIARLMKASGAESLSIAANTFIGQTEAPLVIRPYIASMTQSELFTIMTSGMAHISVGVLAAYMQLLGSGICKITGSAGRFVAGLFHGASPCRMYHGCSGYDCCRENAHAGNR